MCLAESGSLFADLLISLSFDQIVCLQSAGEAVQRPRAITSRMRMQVQGHASSAQMEGVLYTKGRLTADQLIPQRTTHTEQRQTDRLCT